MNKSIVYAIIIIICAVSVSAVNWTWNDLTSTDINNEFTNFTINGYGLVIANEDIYFIGQTGTLSGLFMIYNRTSNTTYRVGNENVLIAQPSVIPIYDGNDIIYTSVRMNGSQSIFSTFNITSKIWTSLNNTDTGNWAGTFGMTSLTYDSVNKKIYTGMQQQRFGVYDIATNVWSDLTGTDLGDWITNTSALTGLVYNNGVVYIGTSSSQVGVYNVSSNTSSLLRVVQGNNAGMIYSDGYLYLPNAGNVMQYNPSTNTSSILINTTPLNLPLFAKTNDILIVQTGNTNSKYYVYNLTNASYILLEQYNNTGWINSTSAGTSMVYDDVNDRLYTLTRANNFHWLGVAYSYTPYTCVENWTQNDTACNGLNYTIQYYDNNSCGTYDLLPQDNGSVFICNLNPMNTYPANNTAFANVSDVFGISITTLDTTAWSCDLYFNNTNFDVTDNDNIPSLNGTTNVTWTPINVYLTQNPSYYGQSVYWYATCTLGNETFTSATTITTFPENPTPPQPPQPIDTGLVTAQVTSGITNVFVAMLVTMIVIMLGGIVMSYTGMIEKDMLFKVMLVAIVGMALIMLVIAFKMFVLT